MNKPVNPDDFIAEHGEWVTFDSQKSSQPDEAPAADKPAAEQPTPLWVDDGGWMEDEIPKRPWIAVGYLMRGAVTALAGPGGVSKSSLAVHYSVALAFGAAFHRFRPLGQSIVLNYNVEDDANEQRRRFSAALRSTGKTPSDLAGKVVRLGPHNVGTLLDRDPNNGRIRFTAAMQRLEEAIQTFRPDVLMLDPLAELHISDENDNGALRAVMATFRALAVKYDLAVLIIHHVRKGAAVAGDPDSVRGASAIIGAARVVLTVAAMSEEEGKAFGLDAAARRKMLRVDGAKSNYAPIQEAEWFQRITVPLDNGDTVATLEPWSPPVDVVTPEMRQAIEAGIAAGSPTGPWSAKLSTEARSVKHLFVRNHVTTAPGQKQLIDELLSSGFAILKFRRQNRAEAMGIRSPDGCPKDVEWLAGGGCTDVE